MNDNKCALWCILAHLFPKHLGTRENGRREQNKMSPNPIHYQIHEKDIDINDIEFPLNIKDINKLENKNDLAI